MASIGLASIFAIPPAPRMSRSARRAARFSSSSCSSTRPTPSASNSTRPPVNGGRRPEGFAILPLHYFGGVTTFLVKLDPGATLSRMIHPDGEEVVVLAGACADAQGTYPAGSWIRDPGGHAQNFFSKDGCTLFVKTGHIAAAAVEMSGFDGARAKSR